jgi:hypothetical protein
LDLFDWQTYLFNILWLPVVVVVVTTTKMVLVEAEAVVY